MNKNNEREYRTRKVHKYKTEDLVLIKNEQSTKYGNIAYSGPYTVTSVNDNGTLYIKKDIVTDVINYVIYTPTCLTPNVNHGRLCNVQSTKRSNISN